MQHEGIGGLVSRNRYRARGVIEELGVREPDETGAVVFVVVETSGIGAATRAVAPCVAPSEISRSP